MKLNLSAGINMFGRIVTLVVFFSSIYIYFTFGMGEILSVSLLWEELGVSFLTSLPFFFRDENGKCMYSSILSMVGIFLYINAVVFLAGFVFEWYDLARPMMLVAMFLTILFVYIVATIITYMLDKQSADEINKRLSARRKNGW